jgi:hypothetical protein
MTPEQAMQAEAAREDGWPYPDDDADMKEAPDATTCPHLNNSRDPEDCWECAFSGLYVTDLDSWDLDG